MRTARRNRKGGVNRRLSRIVEKDMILKGMVNSLRLVDEKGREFNVSVHVDALGDVQFPGDRDWMGLPLRTAVENGEFGVHLDRVVEEFKDYVKLRVMVALHG